MLPTDHAVFFELIGNVYAFYRQDYSKFAGSVWLQAMQPFDFVAISDAMSRHCVNPDSGQFMPKPADIVKMLQGSTQDSALVAWTALDRSVRGVGPYGAPTFNDPIIASVILDMGGWISLNQKTEDEWPFIRNEFVNRYRGYKLRNDFAKDAPRLTGIADHHNRLEGFAEDDNPFLESGKNAWSLADQVIKRVGGTA